MYMYVYTPDGLPNTIATIEDLASPQEDMHLQLVIQLVILPKTLQLFYTCPVMSKRSNPN